MHWTMIEPPPTPAYVVVLDPGDEAVAQLSGFAREQDLEAAQVTAIGGFERSVVGWFDRAAGDYRHIPVAGQCEVLSLIGDIAAGAAGRDHPRRPPAGGARLAHAGSDHPGGARPPAQDQPPGRGTGPPRREPVRGEPGAPVTGAANEAAGQG